jgi:hypothetical protein
MIAMYLAFLSVGRWVLSEVADNSKALTVVDFATGDDSWVNTAHTEYVENADAWRGVWQMHRSRPAATVGGAAASAADETVDLPKVDFSQDKVIAVFGGISQNITGYTLEGVVRIRDHDVIEIKPRIPQAQGQISFPTQPYAFIEIASVKHAIDVMMQVGVDTDGSPIWKLIAQYKKPN